MATASLSGNNPRRNHSRRTHIDKMERIVNSKAQPELCVIWIDGGTTDVIRGLDRSHVGRSGPRTDPCGPILQLKTSDEASSNLT